MYKRQIAIRGALEERGIVNGQVADPEKLDNDPFIQQVLSDVEQIAAAETEQPSEVSISDEEYDAVRSPIPQKTSYDPAAPVYAVGDTVYIEDAAYQITELRDDTVQLLPTGMVYPIYRAERKEQLYLFLKKSYLNRVSFDQSALVKRTVFFLFSVCKGNSTLRSRQGLRKFGSEKILSSFAVRFFRSNP